MENPSTHPHTNNGVLDLGSRRDSLDEVSPLEQEVLDEYARLARNMERVCLIEFFLLVVNPF
jgi:DASH complex subunit Dad3